MLKECLKKLGYRGLTEVQEKAARAILRGDNTLVVSPTGTGKTEAAVFPILYYIWRRRLRPVAAIYITPLRALNRDIYERIQRIATCFGVDVGLRHGDTPRRARRRLLSNPPHMIVTTPETFHYLVTSDTLRRYLANLRFIVLDEYRELLTSKRGLELLASIHLFEQEHPLKLVKIGLTATLSDITYAAEMLGGGNVVVVQADKAKSMEITVTTPYSATGEPCSISDDYFVDSDTCMRIEHITRLIERHKKVLLFVNTRNQAERLGYLLSEYIKHLNKQYSVGVHHGSLSREHRLRIEKGFKEDKLNCLIATSSMELGLDIGNVNHVIQYMSPRQAVRLVQRIGRSRHSLDDTPAGTVITLPNIYDIIETIAIARRSIAGLLEKEERYDAPLDVLAHILAEQLIIKKQLGINEFYEAVKKLPLFKNLTYTHYAALLDYMEYARIIRVHGNTIKPGYRLKKYFYTTTMITDTRSILVIEAESRKKIGVLSEEFVVLNIAPGDTIVLAGSPWRVIEYDEDEAKLYVEPVKEGEEIIPRWEGDSIPVEKETAQEAVHLLRKLAAEYKGTGRIRVDAHGNTVLHIDENTVRYLGKIMSNIISSDAQLPSTNRMIIHVSREEKMLTIHYPLGSRGTALLRELVLAILRAKTGLSKLSGFSTPYSVMVYYSHATPMRSDAELLIQALKELGNEPLHAIHDKLLRIIKTTHAYYWRVYHVAQRLGAVEPGKTRITRRLLEELARTIIGEEALKETLVKDFDLDSVTALLRGISGGHIEYSILYNKENILSKELLSKTPIYFSMHHSTDLNIYLKRILGREITLICLLCGYRWRVKVQHVADEKNIVCPRCGRKYVAAIKGSGEREAYVISKLLKGLRLRSDEKRIFNDLRRRAEIIAQYGGRGVLVLASPGVGSTEAVNVLNKINSGSELAKTLYEAEKHYLRIKKYLKR